MKTNKGFAPIVIILIIVAVLAVGGAAYYFNKITVSISVISPNGGETFVLGQLVNVEWKINNNDNPYKSGNLLQAMLVDEKGNEAHLYTAIADQKKNFDMTEVPIRNVSAGKFKLKLILSSSAPALPCISIPDVQDCEGSNEILASDTSDGYIIVLN